MSSLDVKIQLTEAEEKLFELLLASVEYKGAKTIIRVAGGWVRDKVLCQQSCDIDVALDDQSGVEFATNVNEYLKHMGMETRTIAVIQANPDQSKHLETANLRVLGYEIDCVNLRAETYSETRIPEIRKGTALEDALRRDFTVNTLFYNINTKQVEDLTERGIDDLKQRIIRTPISAHTTFRDDPLRVLRAIRFASRFDFTLDEELSAAASSIDIHTAFLEKVSRERVYKECEGCMTKENSRPYLAFVLMQRLNLLDVILPLESVLQSATLTPDSATVLNAYPSTEALVQSWLADSLDTMYWVNVLLAHRQQTLTNSTTSLNYSTTTINTIHVTTTELSAPKFGTAVKTLFWAAMTTALSKLQVIEKGKPVPLIPVLLREGLKMENITMKTVQMMTECVEAFMALVEQPVPCIVTAGNLLRTCKEHWRDCLLLTCAVTLARSTSSHLSRESGIKRNCPYSPGGKDVVHSTSAEAQQSAIAIAVAEGGLETVFSDVTLSMDQVKIVESFARMQDQIMTMGLDNVWLLKPLINGSELIKVLGLPKGPMVGKLVEQQTLWQIRHPGSTDKEACIEHLKTILPSIM